MNSSIKLPTFLKWAGGKRKILPLIEKFFPKKIDRYFEPFLGGGSVFFYVKQKYNPPYSLISDTNVDLINTYIHVRDNPGQLIKYLSKFKKKNSKFFYYLVRENFNKKKYKGIRRSAAFIYLNKNCFNGLYRVNSKNEFNVPYGKYKNPSTFDEKIIYEASVMLKNGVEIKCQDYQAIISKVKGDDFIYLDPCYDPLKKTSFANYTPERFSTSDRLKLYSFIENLRKKGAKVVLSNNDIPEIHELYSDYNINEILAPRFIGSKVAYRNRVSELVITNY
ncbi:MAG: adenine methylase protein [Parcubacteria group bacterium GW2011_GWA1_47_10]|nr:MAG: adenine methylase protein [Parcubacteria group bacterium GW2011_GWA1_47_10]